MPAPQSSMMKNLARLKFMSYGIMVPNQAPQMNVPKTYADAFKPDERSTVPKAGALFISDSPNKYHVAIQKKLDSEFGTFIDGICDAICSAWSQWQSAATLTGVMVMGPTASGGQVVGPPVQPLILASAPKNTPMMMKYSNAVASTFGTAWLTYTSSIKVTGMPWYPMFAAFPGPIAPPTPNIPCPVKVLAQVPASLAPAALKGMMIGNLGDPQAMFHDKLFEALADAIDKCFQLWTTSTQVTNVLGTGPIPTFAPPFVPVGPVMGGVGNMTPGGFV